MRFDRGGWLGRAQQLDRGGIVGDQLRIPEPDIGPAADRRGTNFGAAIQRFDELSARARFGTRSIDQQAGNRYSKRGYRRADRQ